MYKGGLSLATLKGTTHRILASEQYISVPEPPSKPGGLAYLPLFIEPSLWKVQYCANQSLSRALICDDRSLRESLLYLDHNIYYHFPRSGLE
jgi:hypothetical protein